MDVFNECILELYHRSENYKFPRFLSKKLKLQTGTIVLIMAGICILMMSIGFFDKFICDFLTFGFPAKWTIKSISNPTFASDKLWVTYWVIFSLLKLLDESIPFLIQFVPFFYPIKFFFLLILFAPKIHGGLMIYNNIIAPFIRSNKIRYIFESSTKKKRASY